MLELLCKSSQNFTIIDQEKHKIKQILHLEPHNWQMYYVNIDLHQQYGISVADTQRFFWRNVPGSEELGEMAVFAGWGLNGTFIKSKIKKPSQVAKYQHFSAKLCIGQIEASTCPTPPPPPWAYPGHLTPFPSRGGGNLMIRVFQGVGNLIPML